MAYSGLLISVFSGFMNHENEAGDIFVRKENDGVNMGGEKLGGSKTKRDKREIRGGLSW